MYIGMLSNHGDVARGATCDVDGDNLQYSHLFVSFLLPYLRGLTGLPTKIYVRTCKQWRLHARTNTLTLSSQDHLLYIYLAINNL